MIIERSFRIRICMKPSKHNSQFALTRPRHHYQAPTFLTCGLFILFFLDKSTKKKFHKFELLWRHTSLLNRRVDRVTWHGMLINRFYYMKSFDWMSYSMNKGVSFLRLCSLSSPKGHDGYPNKNNNNGKIESASLFPLPIMPSVLSFLFPSLPTSKRSLCGGEWAMFTLSRIAFRAFLFYPV